MMEHGMKENSKKVNGMGMEHIVGQMEENMLDNF